MTGRLPAVVMISGANRGIGLALARRLHRDGYRLSLGARRLDALAEAVADFATDRLLLHPYEARDSASPAAWVAATAERFGGIDAVINNAAIDGCAGIEDGDEQLAEFWDVNVMAPLRVIRQALPYLRRSGRGRVINMASLSGKRVRNTHAAYVMSKFALIGLTHVVRRLGWEHGVRATAICPGLVATGMVEEYRAVVPDDEMTQPEDIADLVAAVLALPNTASVAELAVNYRLDEMF